MDGIFKQVISGGQDYLKQTVSDHGNQEWLKQKIGGVAKKGAEAAGKYALDHVNQEIDRRRKLHKAPGKGKRKHATIQ